MLKTIFLIAQLVVLLVVGILLWQIWRKIQTIPEDEIVGEERGKYLARRLIGVAVCIGLEAALQIAAAVLRILEII